MVSKTTIPQVAETVRDTLERPDLKVVEFDDPFERPPQEITRRYRRQVLGPSEAIKTIADALLRLPGFAQYDPGYYEIPGMRVRFDLDRAVRCILSEAIQDGVDAAVNRVVDILARNSVDALRVVAFAGVRVPEVGQIGDMTVGPLSSIPDSREKAFAVDRYRTLLSPEPHAYPLGIDGLSAIARQFTIEPLLYAGPIPADNISGDDTFANHKEMARLKSAVLALTLVERACPIVLASWIAFRNPEEVPSLFSTGVQFDYIDASLPMHPRSIGVSAEQTRAAISPFLSLDAGVEQRLRIPLERLNQGRRRQSLADRAIDFGVALESLLDDQDNPGEFTHKVSVRGTLLGARDIEGRKLVRDQLRDLYALRSRAVHAGTLRPKIKGGRRTEEVLDSGGDLIASLIGEIVSRRKFPIWSEFDLVGGGDPDELRS